MTKTIIIGNGPSGIEAAWKFMQKGHQVTLIGEDKLGGRALWHSLLPSKVLFGQAAAPEDGTYQDASAAVEAVLGERLRAAGVEIIQGRAKILESCMIEITPQREPPFCIHGDHLVLATGSKPVFPEFIRPNGGNVFAPKIARKIPKDTTEITVLGGGVTGAEFATDFLKKGMQVRWIAGHRGVLPVFPTTLSNQLKASFQSAGGFLVEGVRATDWDGEKSRLTLSDGNTLRSQSVFLALGRIPDKELEGLEIWKTSGGSLEVIGDAAGGPMMASWARSQAMEPSRSHLGEIQSCFSTPEISWFGQKSEAIPTQRLSLAQDYWGALAAGHLEYQSEGKKILYAGMVGPGAAEVINPLYMYYRGVLQEDVWQDFSPPTPTAAALGFEMLKSIFREDGSQII